MGCVRVWAMLHETPELREFDPEGCDHMTIETWVATVKAGGFIDYDGMGYWATVTHASRNMVVPSDVSRHVAPPPWATHVCWYNR